MAKVGGKRAVGVSRDKMRRTQEKQQQASQAPSDSNLITIPRPAARLQGGPRDGWVYFEADLIAEAKAREASGMPPFPYAPSRAHCTLPWTGGVQGVVWRYRPDLAPPAMTGVGRPTCTRLGCEAKAAYCLTQSVGGGDWLACAAHVVVMEHAMAIGMSGATTGAAWIIKQVVR